MGAKRALARGVTELRDFPGVAEAVRIGIDRGDGKLGQGTGVIRWPPTLRDGGEDLAVHHRKRRAFEPHLEVLAPFVREFGYEE